MSFEIADDATRQRLVALEAEINRFLVAVMREPGCSTEELIGVLSQCLGAQTVMLEGMGLTRDGVFTFIAANVRAGYAHARAAQEAGKLEIVRRHHA